jgi:hypothetical protein
LRNQIDVALRGSKRRIEQHGWVHLDTSKVISLGSIIAHLLASTASLLLSFEAGCAGESRTGVAGDPIQALQSENAGFGLLLLLGWAAFIPIILIRSSKIWRMVAFEIFPGGPVVWYLGIWIEGEGVRIGF